VREAFICGAPRRCLTLSLRSSCKVWTVVASSPPGTRPRRRRRRRRRRRKEEEKEKEKEEEEEEKEEEEGRVRPWALPPPRVADPPLTKQCVAQVAAHVHDPLYSTHEH
jgi:hypothetical protein